MIAPPYKPPPRTRQTIACDLAMALGRITSLRKEMDCLDPDSDTAKAHSWYSTRAALLRRELEELNGPPRR